VSGVPVDKETLAVGLMIATLGAAAILRSDRVNAAHLAVIKVYSDSPRNLPSVRITRLIGWWFVLVGFVLIGASFLI
jgi:hypothetical protein